MFTLLLLTLITPAFSTTDIENKLIISYKRIDYWSERQKTGPEAALGDSLLKANQNFQQLLLKYSAEAGRWFSGTSPRAGKR